MSSNQRVLIVEDEQILAENIKRFLDPRSADVRIAEDGTCAMKMIESFSPDVVVLDYGLPVNNGLQTFVELQRRSARPLGCVMITGYPLEKITMLARPLGIRHFLSKPFRLTELQRLMEQSDRETSADAH